MYTQKKFLYFGVCISLLLEPIAQSISELRAKGGPTCLVYDCKLPHHVLLSPLQIFLPLHILQGVCSKHSFYKNVLGWYSGPGERIGGLMHLEVAFKPC